MADKVFVSPGVYTSERDLSFVTRQVGVTTLGVVGETTQGPAFQPIFVSNYDEFKSFFGGLNATKFKNTGVPKYELPYVAKSYLSQSNQLFVTRVLGLSGYDSGFSWGITLEGALDSESVVETGNYPDNTSLITFTASTAGTITNLVSSEPIIQTLWDNGLLVDELSFLPTSTIGATADIGPIYDKVGSTYVGASFDLYVDSIGQDGLGNTTGNTTGSTIEYSGTPYSDVENKIVALLRSRGSYDSNEILNFEISDTNNLYFDTNVNDASSDPKGNFSLKGISDVYGSFDYSLSFNPSNKNYITRVLGKKVQDGKTSVFVEEIFENMLQDYIAENKVRGININTLTPYLKNFSDYKQEYKPAVTPWIVSELRGSNLIKLFRLWTISDGNSANKQFKISITNINLNTKEFDVQIRAYGDTDAKPVILEAFSKCSMDPSSINYICKKIGTLGGEFVSKSKYVLLEIDEESNSFDAFPSGFLGFPVRDYQVNSNNVLTPSIEYKNTYGTFENKRKFYLGLSNTKGIDQDFFDYKGQPSDPNLFEYDGTTKGFHMDIDANGATINDVPTDLVVGNAEFRSESGVQGTDYEKIYSRKFTFAPYGGFDGWDEYRESRTNTDSYIINGRKGTEGN